jgi:hypothetical protein
VKELTTTLRAQSQDIEIRSFLGMHNGGPKRPYIQIEGLWPCLSPTNARRLIKHINRHLDRIEKAKEEPQTKEEEL